MGKLEDNYLASKKEYEDKLKEMSKNEKTTLIVGRLLIFFLVTGVIFWAWVLIYFILRLLKVL